MSTIKTTHLQHPSASSPNLTLAADGSVSGGAGLGGLTLITAQTFSAVSSVSVNNCFSATYENYRLILDITGSSSAFLSTRMRTGSDDTTSNYHWQSVTATGTGSANMFQQLSQTSWQTTYIPASTYQHLTLDVMQPQTTLNTAALTEAMETSSTVTLTSRALRLQTTTQYTGISFIAGAGTITGTIRVYGYANS